VLLFAPTPLQVGLDVVVPFVPREEPILIVRCDDGPAKSAPKLGLAVAIRPAVVHLVVERLAVMDAVAFL